MHRDERLQEMLDDLFEWQLPSVISPNVRLHIIRMLCAFWVCDPHDLGDAEALIAFMRDLLFGDAISLAVHDGHDFSLHEMSSKNAILGEGGGGPKECP